MAISISFISKVGNIVTLEITNNAQTFQRSFRYDYDNIEDFKEFVRANIQRVVDTYQTIQANIGNTYTINGQDFTINDVTFDSGYVFVGVNSKKVIIYTPRTIQEVAQAIYRQCKT